jgi:nitric oxide dioxygenase
MLSRNTIELVKSTIPLLSNAGPAVTEHFYKRLFTHNPELKNIFNMSHQVSGRQQFALFEALAAYATHIDNLDVLKSAVARITQKHSSLNILPVHYDIVGMHLIETLKELAPSEFTPKIAQAWTEAYGLLADVFITKEEAIYTNNEQGVGGWRGTRAFKINNIVSESEHVKSFYLTPCDEQAIIDFTPGQYISVHVKPVNSENTQIRQYSLSSIKQNNTYRISVKNEGLVSGYLHSLGIDDEIQLSPPSGDFVLKNHNKNPIFLISAGVGITPMMTMLNTLVVNQSTQPTYFLHACINQQAHSFKQETASLMDKLPNSYCHFWYESIEKEEAAHHGRINFSNIELPLSKGAFYLCGPTPFMKDMKNQLLALNVPAEAIFYEVFGPHETM